MKFLISFATKIYCLLVGPIIVCIFILREFFSMNVINGYIKTAISYLILFPLDVYLVLFLVLYALLCAILVVMLFQKKRIKWIMLGVLLFSFVVAAIEGVMSTPR